MNAPGAYTLGFQFLQGRGEQFEDVRDEPHMRDLEDRRRRVRVNRNDQGRVLHPRDALLRPADAARDVELRTDRLAALADLTGLREPVNVRQGPRGADDASDRLREFFD